MSRKLVLMLVIILVAGALVGYFGFRARNDERIPLLLERKVREDAVMYAGSIEVPFNIGGLKFFNGQLFVYNFSDQQILLLDSTGKTKKSWGKKGEAPGEFQQIIEWDVNSEGISVVDGRKLTITEMNNEGLITSHHKLKTAIYRAHRLAKNEYILKFMDPQNMRRQIFQLLNLSTNGYRNLNLEFPQVENDMSFDGGFAKNDSGQRFYFCHWAGYFLSFDAKGEFLYGAETIDRTEPPDVIETGPGAMRRDPKASLVNLSLSSTDNVIYILSRATSNLDAEKSYVDVYDVHDGHYKWSIVIPAFEGSNTRTLASTTEGLYTFQAQHIVYYKVKK